MAESEALERARQFFRDLVPPGEPGIEDLRKSYDRSFAQFPIPADAEIEAIDADGVSCIQVIAPGAVDGRTLVYCHGGGYCMGSARAYRSLGYALSKAAQARVLLVDYRLAPEHPHPAAVEDAVTAFKYACAHGNPATTGVIGDSAGGGLVLATCMALRDGGDPLPAVCICMSPFADLAGEGESMDSKAGEDPIVSRALVDGLGGMYMNGADPKATPLASPVFASDFTGLAPTLILVGTAECLLDDSLRLEKSLQAAGGEVELTVADDMIHVWPVFCSFLPEAQAAVEQMAAFVRKHC